MPDSSPSRSVLIISQDTELVEILVAHNTTGQEFLARDSMQFITNDPELLDNNSIVIFDAGIETHEIDDTIGHILKLKQLDPTQVLILTGDSDVLGDLLKTNIQPLVFRAFTKPISANQVFLAFKSANALHEDLIEKQASGINISTIGPAENKTSVESLVKERKSNTAIYAAIAVFALVIVAWLISSGTNEQSATEVDNYVETAATETDSSIEDADDAPISISNSVQRVNKLNQLAANAMLDRRVISPKGDNALYYYDQVLAIDAYDTTAYQGKKSVADELRASYNSLLGTAEFDRALKVLNVLQRIEPLNLDNDALGGGLEKAINVHVKKIKSSGTSAEIARTAAVLEKMGDEFEGSKSASAALRAEQKLISKIDSALKANNLTPPNNGNAYSLVSGALKSNTVSKANIEPRVRTLSTKILKLADTSYSEDDLENASKLAALVKRLNVNRKELATLSKNIADKKAKLNPDGKESAAAKEGEITAEIAPAPAKIIPAKIITRTQPRYPRRAIDREIEGWVKVQFELDIQGRPREISVIEADPKGVFENSAIKAVEKWRFSPARNEQTGLPVEADSITTKLSFNLE